MPKISHQELTRGVKAMPEEEVREKFVRLLEAVDPGADCICSDLRVVTEDEVQTCALHTSKVSWIVHTARLVIPDEVLPYQPSQPQ